jgi:hypothetical protein
MLGRPPVGAVVHKAFNNNSVIPAKAGIQEPVATEWASGRIGIVNFVLNYQGFQRAFGILPDPPLLGPRLRGDDASNRGASLFYFRKNPGQ